MGTDTGDVGLYVSLGSAGAILLLLVFLVRFSHGVGRWQGTTEEKLKGLNKRVKDVRNEVSGLRDEVRRFSDRLGYAAAQGASPLRLTDFGERLADNIEAREWAAEIAGDHAPHLRDKEPYEVDQFAAEYVAGQLSVEMMVRVARCAYQFGVDSSEPETVLRVLLRDAILSIHQVAPSVGGAEE